MQSQWSFDEVPNSVRGRLDGSSDLHLHVPRSRCSQLEIGLAVTGYLPTLVGNAVVCMLLFVILQSCYWRQRARPPPTRIPHRPMHGAIARSKLVFRSGADSTASFRRKDASPLRQSGSIVGMHEGTYRWINSLLCVATDTCNFRTGGTCTQDSSNCRTGLCPCLLSLRHNEHQPSATAEWPVARLHLQHTPPP